MLNLNIKFNSIFITLVLLSSGCIGGSDNSIILGTEYKDPPLAPDFTLKNQDGELVKFSDYEGKVIVVAFIYTTCPDVCLIISANLDYVDDNLGEYSEDVVILSVTIDPARDTVEHLVEDLNQIPGAIVDRFIGQSKRGKKEGMTQKQQLKQLERYLRSIKAFQS